MKPRVFIGLIEVAGYYQSLKRGFDEIGVPATLVILRQHRFSYKEPEPGRLVRFVRFCFGKADSQQGKSRLKRLFWRALESMARAVIFAAVIWRHDVFIFGFGMTFFRGYDLPILKFFGKKIICQFHGSDSRPAYLDGSAVADGAEFDVAYCIEQTREQKKHIDRLNRSADVLIDIPPQGYFHQKHFVNWLRVGLPLRPDERPGDQTQSAGVRVRILHSPSHPQAKGTARIREAVAQVKAQGVDLELIEIMGKPNSVVLDELARCDFVIDQLYADYAMPGFATEAAWFSKAVLICGYAVEMWEELLPEAARPPTCYVHPDKLQETIHRLAVDVSYRREVGRRSRVFVQDVWAARLVAQRYLDLMVGKVPADWMIDPQRIRYVHGCCLSEADARRRINLMLQHGGPSSLQVDDKPELLRALMEFAAELDIPADAKDVRR